MDAAGGGDAMAVPSKKAELDLLAKEDMEVSKAKQAETSAKKIVADRTFTLRDGVWEQDGYTKDTPSKTLRRDSNTFKTFFDKHPELKSILELGNHVVFEFENNWYRIEPKKKRN